MVVAHRGMRTLASLRRRKMWRAEGGKPGGPAKRHGRNGEDMVIAVPVGTAVWKSDGHGSMTQLADLTGNGQTVVPAAGGKGGKGNARFATATKQAPRIAERGQRGEECTLLLDLKLLSDVGIIGLPNAGKSTLLRAVSRARPKVAAYPFTTLEPHLGVVETSDDAFVVADIPGLIEGAHEGAGLGLEFLRHVERARVLVHLLDGSRPDPAADREALNRELGAFAAPLLEKRQLLAVNKLDLPEVRARRALLRRTLRAADGALYFISAATGQGVQQLVSAMAAAAREQDTAPAPRELPLLRPGPRGPQFTVTRVRGGFRVAGDEPLTLVQMLGLDSDEARVEVRRRLARMGVMAALRRAGARPGHRVWFGDVEMEWEA